MNDEIKEILYSLENQCKSSKGCVNSYFKVNNIKILLDYITILQQAVKDTKDTADDMLFELKQENERLKNRIYKARKMIFDNYGLLDKYEIEILDDILQGDSE